ncbi:chloramphenicol acetyltransferase [Candidatus Bipolaricaulota bacterium]|nr:chloramphenicol acetyltransferase [Candidatus Bipolaricaulota bacterium]
MSEDVRRIDLDSWPRRKHFELFRSFAYPYFNLCANVDVACLVRAVRERHASFTAHLVYCLTRAANEIPELRQRIRGNDVIEHRVVHPSITVLTENDLFAFCFFEYAENAGSFVRSAIEAMERAKQDPSLDDEPGRDDFLFMTAIPWVSFNSMMHPVPLSPPDSVPRVAWGRYRIEGGHAPMPLSLHAHHGLVDGIHTGRFFARVEELIDSVESWADGSE